MCKYENIGEYICVEDCKLRAVDMDYEFLDMYRGSVHDCTKWIHGNKKKLKTYIEYLLHYKVSEEDFFKFCIPYSNKYILETTENKRLLGIKYKSKERNKFCFEKLTEKSLIELHCKVFYYIEEIKRLVPEILGSFAFTICDTLKHLENMSSVLSEADFIKAVNVSNPLFEKIYHMGMDSINKDNGFYYSKKEELINDLLEQFTSDIEVKIDVVQGLNR